MSQLRTLENYHFIKNDRPLDHDRAVHGDQDDNEGHRQQADPAGFAQRRNLAAGRQCAAAIDAAVNIARISIWAMLRPLGLVHALYPTWPTGPCPDGIIAMNSVPHGGQTAP